MSKYEHWKNFDDSACLRECGNWLCINRCGKVNGHEKGGHFCRWHRYEEGGQSVRVTGIFGLSETVNFWVIVAFGVLAFGALTGFAMLASK